MILKVKLLRPGIEAPRYHSDGAAGLDLCAAFEPELDGSPTVADLDAHEYYKIPCGIALEINAGFEGQVRARSSWAEYLAYWHVGTIDSDYIGELSCCFVLRKPLRIKYGERIGQLIISPAPRAEVVTVDELTPTVRGSSGYGSTGK